MIRSRTRAALAVKKARGERVGGIPYGYRLGDDGKLVEDEGEQATIARARELRAEGASLREVGRRRLKEGHPPRTGQKWHIQVAKRLIGGEHASRA